MMHKFPTNIDSREDNITSAQHTKVRLRLRDYYSVYCGRLSPLRACGSEQPEWLSRTLRHVDGVERVTPPQARSRALVA